MALVGSAACAEAPRKVKMAATMRPRPVRWNVFVFISHYTPAERYHPFSRLGTRKS